MTEPIPVDRFAKIEARLDVIEGKLTMLQWMLGVQLALTAGALFKLLAL